jgi:hypothetical protein
VSVTGPALLEEIQYAVVEPPDLGVTWESELWDSTEVLAYANQRQNRMLRETLLLVGQAAPIAVSAGTFRVTLPDDWVRTVRIVWRGSDGVTRALDRSDTFAADNALPTWMTTTGTPLVYMDEETPTLEVQLAPAPDVDGYVDLWYIPLGAELDLTADPEILTVPDEEAPSLKYGILADMLVKDGRGRDSVRAEYGQQRFQLGVDLAKIIMDGWA